MQGRRQKGGGGGGGGGERERGRESNPGSHAVREKGSPVGSLDF